jgi:hypothetical protein
MEEERVSAGVNQQGLGEEFAIENVSLWNKV